MTLEQIRQLCDEATPGPWSPSSTSLNGWYFSIGPRNALPQVKRDAQFIAAARTLLPKLLAVAEAAQDLYDWGVLDDPEIEWLTGLRTALEALTNKPT